MSQPTLNNFFKAKLTPAEELRKRKRDEERHQASVKEMTNAHIDPERVFVNHRFE